MLSVKLCVQGINVMRQVENKSVKEIRINVHKKAQYKSGATALD